MYIAYGIGLALLAVIVYFAFRKPKDVDTSPRPLKEMDDDRRR